MCYKGALMLATAPVTNNSRLPLLLVVNPKPCINDELLDIPFFVALAKILLLYLIMLIKPFFKKNRSFLTPRLARTRMISWLWMSKFQFKAMMCPHVMRKMGTLNGGRNAINAMSKTRGVAGLLLAHNRLLQLLDRLVEGLGPLWRLEFSGLVVGVLRSGW
ncbi:hypothetical protein Leryth_002104 [Lithospermum erythrorhizon]|nr:hypothetical protein Leryth_002104 [Lithospermum erythrorhizon]